LATRKMAFFATADFVQNLVASSWDGLTDGTASLVMGRAPSLSPKVAERKVRGRACILPRTKQTMWQVE
jgi:hypothetical protein